MEVLEIVDLPDGGANMTVEYTDEEGDLFFKLGLEEMASRVGLAVLPPLSEAESKDIKHVELEDETFQAVIAHGITTALVRAVEELEKKELD